MPRQFQLTERAFHAGAVRERGEVVTLRDDERPGSHMRPYEAPQPIVPVVVDPSGAIARGPKLPTIAAVLDSPQSVPDVAPEDEPDLPSQEQTDALRAFIDRTVIQSKPAALEGATYDPKPRHRGFLIVDTETNGFKDPRMASIAVAFADYDLLTEYEYTAMIRPEGWEMDPEAEKVNGLSMEKLRAGGRDLIEALVVLEVGIRLGRTLVCHNAAFDLRVIRGEMKRRRRIPGLMPYPYVCTMLASRRMVGTGKLADAYAKLMGRPLENAHDALADMRACQAILGKMRAHGLDVDRETQRDEDK